MSKSQYSKIVMSFFLALALVTAEPPAKEADAREFITITAEVTSYSSDPFETDDSPEITANQTRVHEGTIACPRRYEFGTKVWVEGKQYVCEDRMNIRYKDRFDIWSPNKEVAKEWGIKKLSITIEL